MLNAMFRAGLGALLWHFRVPIAVVLIAVLVVYFCVGLADVLSRV